MYFIHNYQIYQYYEIQGGFIFGHLKYRPYLFEIKIQTQIHAFKLLIDTKKEFIYTSLFFS